MTTTTPTYYVGAPVQMQSSLLTLPGNLVGSICQQNVDVLFGVNRDFVCQSTIVWFIIFCFLVKYFLVFDFYQNLCTTVTSIPSVLQGGGSNSNVNISFYTQSYIIPTSTSRNLATEYYFQDSYSLSINNIPSVSGTIYDYCLNQHPLNRTQRYFSACIPPASTCSNGYQTWSGCAERDTFSYNAIPASFFVARSSSIDDSTNFADFINATNVPLSCMFY